MKNFNLKSISNFKNDAGLLKQEVINMLREQFTLRMQIKIGQLKKVHLLKKNRRDIAFIKFREHNNSGVVRK